MEQNIVQTVAKKISDCLYLTVKTTNRPPDNTREILTTEGSTIKMAFQDRAKGMMP
jgi:hypothetical protein